MSPENNGRASKSKSKRPHYRRIATEEAWSIPEQMDVQRELVASAKEYDPDLFLWNIQTDPTGPVYHNLLDLYDERLKLMDKYDVDMHLLALTSTGVQMMPADKANEVAQIGNDRLAEAITPRLCSASASPDSPRFPCRIRRAPSWKSTAPSTSSSSAAS